MPLNNSYCILKFNYKIYLFFDATWLQNIYTATKVLWEEIILFSFFFIPTLPELFKPNLLPLKTPQKNNTALIPQLILSVAQFLEHTNILAVCETEATDRKCDIFNCKSSMKDN